ncbi:MAG: SPOR domain-containing protein [Terriglobales bacterium]
MATSKKDTEITLGTGRMLVVFFVFVLVCAVFFAIGFSLGRKTTLALGGDGMNGSVAAAGGMRPTTGDTDGKAASHVDQDADKSRGVNAAAAAPESHGSAAPGGSHPPAGTTNSSSTLAAGLPNSVPANGAASTAGSYYVQVAAVSRQEDAESLVEALKKKQYPAFAVNNPPADKFFHVQVGPYAEIKEADAMRTRLIADGYNPILKK